jgi:hypothetical protein
MLEVNAVKLLERLRPGDRVLDVGGWACPFNRADWVLDAEPYETRGHYGRTGGVPWQGGGCEHFTADTWVRQDICAGSWPFDDRSFDLAICSQTLEDVRDPLHVCAELVRVAKAGYLEVPSRLKESCLGHERSNQAGLSHHRWLIEIAGDHVVFLQKYHLIHTSRRFHLPARVGRRLTPEQAVAWLWWEGTFTFEERTIHGVAAQELELERFVDRYAPCPRWRRAVEGAVHWASALPARVVNRNRRRLDRRRTSFDAVQPGESR